MSVKAPGDVATGVGDAVANGVGDAVTTGVGGTGVGLAVAAGAVTKNRTAESFHL